MPQAATLPDAIARARALAETSLLTLRDIAAQTGLSPGTVGRHARRQGWQRPTQTPPRQQLTARLWQAAGQQLASVEAQLRDGAANAALRDLAVLTKVMRDLYALEAEAPQQAATPHQRTDAEIRATIWQRIQRLRALEPEHARDVTDHPAMPDTSQTLLGPQTHAQTPCEPHRGL